MDLFHHYCAGETLIIEHLRFAQEDDVWVRYEMHSIVGREAEEWRLRCTGPGDHSNLKGPPGPEDDACLLCQQHRVHTKALHRQGGRT
jgi:hypothetical protein